MRTAAPRDTLHTVWMNAEILCLRCRSCGHRAALVKSGKLDIHRNSGDVINRLKLKCGGCGGTDVERLIPRTKEEACSFVAGQ